MKTKRWKGAVTFAVIAGILALSGCPQPGGGGTDTYTVTFNAGGGTPAPAVQAVADGGKAAEPPAMTKTGFTFGGWFKEAALTSQWDFTADTVTADITLYARWIYNFTTQAEYRGTATLAGGTVTGNSVYGAGAFPEDRTVTLSPFQIAKYETTYELWYEVWQWAASNGYAIANGTEGEAPTEGGKYEPVTTINWRDAIVWCNAYSEMWGKEPVYYTDSGYGTVLRTSTNEGGTNTPADNAVMKPEANGYRLPTEAEWEYAARGGTPDPAGPFADKWAGTDEESALDDYAWYYDNSGNATHPVGGKTGNGLGLHDMSGNVWEWCWDWYGGISSPETVSNPAGADAGAARVVRGGSCLYDASDCAVAHRGDVYPGYRDDVVGFRVACAP